MKQYIVKASASILGDSEYVIRIREIDVPLKNSR